MFKEEDWFDVRPPVIEEDWNLPKVGFGEGVSNGFTGV